MSFKRSREGYLLIDNRNNAGVDADFVHRSGLDAQVVGAGQTYESPTITCAHCNGVVVLNPDRKRPRNYCAKCNDYVCDTPACALECTPFQRTLEDLYNFNCRTLFLGG